MFLLMVKTNTKEYGRGYLFILGLKFFIFDLAMLYFQAIF
tara:strand:- start:148 stop:267 length:120 start_codon:yes stop_codon:yes gene_type:complete